MKGRSSVTSTRVIFSLLLSVVAGLTSCHSQRNTKPEPRRYRLTGTIVSVDKQAQQAVIQHDEIPGYMSAMTMAYTIRDSRALQQLAPGDLISADLIVEEDRSWLENIDLLLLSFVLLGFAPGLREHSHRPCKHEQCDPSYKEFFSSRLHYIGFFAPHAPKEPRRLLWGAAELKKIPLNAAEPRRLASYTASGERHSGRMLI